MWLQLINRFRTDPQGELDRLTSQPEVRSALDFFDVNSAVLQAQFQALRPAPPLAWNTQLHDSATYYSNLVIENDQQSHTLDEWNILERIQQFGYDFSRGGTVAENLFAYSTSAEFGHAAFVIDWGFTPTGLQQPPGHRQSLISPEYREIGVSSLYDRDTTNDVGPHVITQHFATDFADGPFLTGVAFQDADGNAFYSPGEGISEFQVDVLDSNGRTVATTKGFASGGYSLDVGHLTAADYRIRMYSPSLIPFETTARLSDTDNVLLDFLNPTPSIDALTAAILEPNPPTWFDLNHDDKIDSNDRNYLIVNLLQTYFGDSNLDGEFNTSDLITVFQANEYEDSAVGNSTWKSGDWNGDFEFDTRDLVFVFQQGGYEAGPRIAAHSVPEPYSAIHTFVLCGIAILLAAKKRSRQGTVSNVDFR
ncbi:MAG: CAP domain-containing protein [Pirellulaceae bacterium]